MANGLEAFRDELPPSAASIILQVQSQQRNALAGTWGRDLRPPLKLVDSVEKQYFYRKRVFQPTRLLPDCPVLIARCPSGLLPVWRQSTESSSESRDRFLCAESRRDPT